MSPTMLDPIQDRRSGSRVPAPPQMAMRVAVLGIVAFALFTIIFFRLWFLQVLSGDQYLRQAQVNKVRTERIAAPRGEIKDRKGDPLVVNEQATVITLDPRRLPAIEKQLAADWGKRTAQRNARITELRRARNREVRRLRAAGRRAAARAAARRQVKVPEVSIPPVPAPLQERFRELGRVVQMRPSTIQERVILGLWLTPYAPVKVKTGVDDDVRDYLLERPDRFPGVVPQQTYLRHYPYDNLAAQIFGTVGQISRKQIDAGTYRGATAGEIVGQGGLEFRYDADLRGRDGLERFLVDAQGNPKGSGRQRAPVAGRSLKLTLDKTLQQVGQQAIAENGGGRPGGFVAMNPNTGAVYALGSYPSYDANILAKPITQAKYDEVFGIETTPAVNRAITGAYPTGSTFKPITALAALKAGLITPTTPIASPPCVEIAKQSFCNAGNASLGSPDLAEALKVSSDVYFYRLGQWANGRQGQLIQSMARKLGLDHRTGIDLPGEFGGTIPDRRWRQRLNEKELAYEAKHHNVCPPDCVYSDKRQWTVGDNVQVAVGQGDIQATPLQMAVAYAALANNGTVVRPHLGMEIDDASGRLVRRIRPGRARKVAIDPAARAAIMQGLHEAASAPGGTSADVFKGWPQDELPVYGKTGTAERAGRPDDQSWYVAWVPGVPGDPDRPPIVIAATIEDAGFGADAAAPAVCDMLSHWYRVKTANCAPGASHTR